MITDSIKNTARSIYNKFFLEKELDNKLKQIASSKKTVIIGPWISEVGYEVLYWLPFLNWIYSKYGISPKRCIAVSRGGVISLYKKYADDYLDVFDFYTPYEFKMQNSERFKNQHSIKQLRTDNFDKEIIDKVLNKRGFEKYELLHPSFMYNLFAQYWFGLQYLSYVEKFCKFEAIDRYIQTSSPDSLPKNYIAVKFYFRSSFPKNKNNVKSIKNLLYKLSEKNNVVVLNTGFSVDDHEESQITKNKNIYFIKNSPDYRNNLEVQLAILRKAKAFVGTYGGFSYLAPFMGINAVSFYAGKNDFLYSHLDVLYKARQTLETNKKISFVLLDLNDLNSLQKLNLI